MMGDDLMLTDGLSIRHHTLREIVDVGYDKYIMDITTLTSGVYDIADILWFEMGIWYEDIKDEWSFFLQKCISHDEPEIVVKIFKDGSLCSIQEHCMKIGITYKNALNFLFGKNGDYVLGEKRDGDVVQTFLTYVEADKNGVYFVDENSFKFTRPFFEMTTEFLKQINWMSEKQGMAYDLSMCGNRRAKLYLLKQMKEKRKRKSKETISLDSIVSSLIAKGQPYDKIWDYPIYMIHDIHGRLNKIQQYQDVMYGYYNGRLEAGKINWEKLNWSAILNN
jgi:hypothetical protein